jgi:two-component system KDP operon response regulator KdpE
MTPQSSPTVLIVEDEAHMRRFLSTTLTHNGYSTIEASTGARALQAVRGGRINVVLLDLGLPDLDGAEVATLIRETSEAPIIVISARDSEKVKIDALDRGANDYVTKPFDAGELLARIRVALRVASPFGTKKDAVFSVGELRVDLPRRLVWLGDKEIHLTPTEFDMLTILVEQAGRVVGHREMLRRVWGPEAVNETQYLRVFMRQLRFKLEPEPAQPRYLLTVAGVGYRLRADS